jgi:hypothetical protein
MVVNTPRSEITVARVPEELFETFLAFLLASNSLLTVNYKKVHSTDCLAMAFISTWKALLHLYAHESYMESSSDHMIVILKIVQDNWNLIFTQVPTSPVKQILASLQCIGSWTLWSMVLQALPLLSLQQMRRQEVASCYRLQESSSICRFEFSIQSFKKRANN